MTSSTAHVESLWRHPIKGFTPESLKQVFLEAGGYFPNDRMFAIEDGPSGFDPDEPKHISKMRFAVLARSAKIANFETMYLDDRQELEIFERDENCICRFDMSSDEGFEDLSDWLTNRLGDEFNGPLKVIAAPKDHRFVDHFTAGFVSLINSNSVEALAAASQTEIGFQRFRPNIVFSADAWMEDHWSKGQRLKIGGTELEILAPTVRCKATHANPETARYDVDTVSLLMQHFKRRTMGIYAQIVKTGFVAIGDKLEVLE